MAILVLNRVWYGLKHSSLELGMFLGRSYSFIIIKKSVNKSPSQLMFETTVLVITVINRVAKIKILVINRVGSWEVGRTLPPN